MKRLYVKQSGSFKAVGWICPCCGFAIIDKSQFPLREYRNLLYSRLEEEQKEKESAPVSDSTGINLASSEDSLGKFMRKKDKLRSYLESCKDPVKRAIVEALLRAVALCLFHEEFEEEMQKRGIDLEQAKRALEELEKEGIVTTTPSGLVLASD